MSDAEAQDHDAPAEAEEEYDGDGLPIVGIGVGAGSLPSLETLFRGIPADLGAAYVIAVRQLEGLDVKTAVDVLTRASSLPVTIGRDGERLEANHIYVGGPQDMITVADGQLGIRDAVEPVGHRGTIDTLLISLAEHARDRAVAVILGGIGSDGTAGITATKKYGGLSIAEGEAGEEGDIAQGAVGPSGAVDVHAPIDQIAARIGTYLKSLAALEGGREADEASGQIEARVTQITTILRNVTSHDFHGYKRGTFLRRVHRRLQVLQIEKLDDYIAHLRGDRDEVQNLFQDLLIGVTQFFRDPRESRCWRARSPACSPTRGPATSSASGCSAARPARRPIRSPSSCASIWPR